MFDENSRVLDVGSWEFVYSFFHPEEQVFHSASSLTDIYSDIIGVSKDNGRFSPGIYGGQPAYLTWAADDQEESVNYWRAQIMVAAGTGIDDSIVVSITDAQGEYIDAATLILLSSTLNVLHGKAYYSLSEFQEHLSNTEVALIFPDGRRIPGTLKLGDEFL